MFFLTSSSVINPRRGLYNRAIKSIGHKVVIRLQHCRVLSNLNMLSFDNSVGFAKCKSYLQMLPRARLQLEQLSWPDVSY